MERLTDRVRRKHPARSQRGLFWSFALALLLSATAHAQFEFGAPVPPLVSGADPMIQGTPVEIAPNYGAPVTPAQVPSFWQAPPPTNIPQIIETLPPPSGQVIGGEFGVPGAPQIINEIVPPGGEELIQDAPPSNPVWYNPFSWLGPYWDGSIEVGLNGSSGNADARSIRTGFDLSRETQRTNWDISLTYNKNEANGTETQHNALFWSNWDFKMRNPKWTWFTKVGLEYDEFKNFDVRLSANTGLGYLLIDTDTTQFRPRFGAGASREVGGVVEEWAPEAVFGFDFTRQISSRQQFKAIVDYFPRWDDFSDYRIVSDFSWELVLDEVNNLSLKVGVIDRYDSTPNGAQANDVDYSVLLLWSL